MQSSSAVNWPSSWRVSAEPRHYANIIVLLILVAVPGAISIYYIQDGRIGTAKYFAAFSIVFGIAAHTGYHRNIRRRKRGALPLATRTTDSGGRATHVPYSGEIFAGYWLAMSAVALIFVMAAIDFSRFYSDGTAVAGVVVCGTLSLLFASHPLLVAIGKFRKGYLLISPEGIYQRGWTFRSYLPWSSILAVRAYYVDRPNIMVVAGDDSLWERKQITRLWRQDRVPLIPEDEREIRAMMDIPGMFLAADPAVVLYMLCYYADHPEARSELGTEAALRRARTAAFG